MASTSVQPAEGSDEAGRNNPSQHSPNLAGSVISADGVGGEKICKCFLFQNLVC